MIRKLIAAYLAYRNEQKTRRLLHSLGDHTLRDIGLRRDQIDYLRVDTPPQPEPVRPRVRAITVPTAS